MLDINDDAYEDDLYFENYETSSILCESFQRQRPPFLPIPGGNIPPINNYPPVFDVNSPPGFNFPGGAFNPPGLTKSPPPNYIPNKNSAGVQSLSSIEDGIETKAVSSNSIRFCIYKFTYIWERNGRNYWAFLLNVDRHSVSGFRWHGKNWVYWGIDLRRIDSFICYRSTFETDYEDCKNQIKLDSSEIMSPSES